MTATTRLLLRKDRLASCLSDTIARENTAFTYSFTAIFYPLGIASKRETIIQ